MKWLKTSASGCFVISVAERYLQVDCMRQGAALAYATVLSMVPLLSASFALIKMMPWFAHMGDQIQAMIIKNFVAHTASTVQQHLDQFIGKASKTSYIGLFFLLFSAVMLVFNIEKAFNKIWGVPQGRQKLIWFSVYCVVLTMMPVLIAAGMGLSAYVMAYTLQPVAEHFAVANRLYFYLAPYVVGTIFFSLINFSIPNCRVPAKAAIIGGATSAVLFELMKFGFSIYFANFSNYKHIYGALAAVPMFIMSVYASWLIILFGAVVSSVSTEQWWSKKKR